MWDDVEVELVAQIDAARGQVAVRVLVGFAVGLVAPWLAPFVWAAALPPARRWLVATVRLGAYRPPRDRLPLEDLRSAPPA